MKVQQGNTEFDSWPSRNWVWYSSHCILQRID